MKIWTWFSTLEYSTQQQRSSWKEIKVKQRFATTFRPLTQEMMGLVYWSTFLVHFTMLAPIRYLILNDWRFYVFHLNTQKSFKRGYFYVPLYKKLEWKLRSYLGELVRKGLGVFHSLGFNIRLQFFDLLIRISYSFLVLSLSWQIHSNLQVDHINPITTMKSIGMASIETLLGHCELKC